MCVKKSLKICALYISVTVFCSLATFSLAVDSEIETALRQQERKIAAEHVVEDGIAFYKAGNFAAARKEFLKVKKLDPGNEAAEKYLARIENKLLKARKEMLKDKVRAGVSNYKAKNYEQAAELFMEVLEIDPNHSKAQKYLAKCDTKLGILEKRVPSEEYQGVTTREINGLYEKGRVLYDNARYDEAREVFSEIVAYSPNHVPAARYIDSCNSRLQEIADEDQAVLNKEEMITLRKSWFPQKEFEKEDILVDIPAPPDLIITAAREKIEKELDQIIPLIDFTNARLRDLITSLSGMSGVNIILDESVFPAAGAPEDAVLEGDITAEELLEDADAAELAELEALLSEEIGETDSSGVIAPSVESGEGGEVIDDTITISLRNIPLREALRYIVKAKGLKYRIDDYAVVISTPENLIDEEMETRYYHLKSGIGAFTAFIRKDPGAEAGETTVLGGDVSTETISIKDVLEQSGVPWPEGSKIFLHERTSTLIARNSPTNLSIIEDVLRVLDVTALQIEIQAKFVDLNETDASELGLEWMLTSDWGIKRDKSGRGITMNSNSLFPTTMPDAGPGFGQYPGGESTGYGLTRGLRFLEDAVTANPLGNILSIGGILTEPEFQVILHALSRNQTADILSSPRVVTLNNQEATIRIVDELIYPTEYEITPPTWSNVAGEVTIVNRAAVAPGGFETREIGVILKVIPNVGADNKTINLAIIPEVSELTDWTAYDFAYGSQILSLPQPYISTRLVTTNVIINDGETIVLGGLMKEMAIEKDDKVPILGDIPFLGRLFRSESESNTKRNLMIFVTANLLTPTGEAFAIGE
ncbi:MAG: tetratricopeptide repeat protein [Candidatus Aureabacteria bacterium]|nr:tetratricopeptide repeat protein [Candidatus Auribacterota bacterium]